MNLLIAFIAFDLIVIIHELGHFIAAKLSGIKVIEFSLFMGPKLFGFKRGGTNYSLRLIPILAYVKMEGEEEVSDSEGAYNKKPLYIRAIVALAGPFANLLTAFIIMLIVFSISGYSTMQIKTVDPDSPAAAAGIQPGDVIRSYDGKSLYQPIDLVQFVYVYKGRHSEIVLVRGNQTITSSIDPKFISGQTKYLFGFTVKAADGTDSNVINEIYPGMPAEKAGIVKGDRIIGLNGVQIAGKKDIDAFMSQNQQKAVNVKIVRNNQIIILNVTPQPEKVEDQYYVGVDFNSEHGSVFSIIDYSLKFTFSTVRSVVYSLFWLITGRVSVSQMMGPIGIVSTISSVAQQSPTFALMILNLLNITAFISIALGATNLIPFPALDGSKLVLIAVEAIRKKPLSPEKESYISMVGFFLLIILAVFTFYNDIMRLLKG